MIDVLCLLLDFGVLVLIWLVQLVIYPAFQYFSLENFRRWHSRYTFRVSLVVMPLLLGQLATAGYQLFFFPDLFSISSAILIGLAWILTFFFAVPLHNKLASGTDHLPLVKRLIQVNWLRTLIWTIVFIISSIRWVLHFP